MRFSRILFAARPVGSSAALGLASLAGVLAAQQPVVVRTVAPEQRALTLSSTQPGTAEAFYEADLGAKVSGFVSELSVDVGTRCPAACRP